MTTPHGAMIAEAAEEARAERSALLAALPFPVAHPFAFALNPALDPALRLGNVVFTAYQAMRLSALLLLSEYLASDEIAKELEGPIRRLTQPHWAEWSVLLERLCARRRSADPEHALTRIAKAWPFVPPPAPEGGRGLLAGLPGREGPARNANDAFWKLRNDLAHRHGTHTLDRNREDATLTRYLPLLEVFVASLFPASAFTLYRGHGAREDGSLRVVRLHGPHEDLLFSEESLGPEWAGAFENTQLVAAFGDRALSVFPLLLPVEQVTLAHTPPSGLVEPLLLVDGLARNGLLALGVQCQGIAGPALEVFRRALARKDVALGVGADEADRWTIADWSRWQTRATLERLEGEKFFPHCYVERATVDAVAAARLEQPGRALLVLGEAGSGKSSLLAHLAARLVQERHDPPAPARGKRAGPEDAGGARYFAAKGRGDVVIFLSGHADLKADAGVGSATLLCDAVALRAGVRARSFATLEAFVDRLEQSASLDERRDRRVWILIDALNEADRFTDLVAAIDAFLPAVGRYDWLRLVVSMRSGAYHALARRNELAARHVAGLFDNASLLHAFASDSATDDVPWLEVLPFSPEEAEQAYDLRKARAPERSARAEYAMLPPALRELLCTPLYLHLFHEAWAGSSEPPADLDEQTLRDAYLDRLCRDLPGLRRTLAELGARMFERRAPVLSAEVAEAWMTRWRAQLGGSSLERVLKLDPVEELVAASVLMVATEDGALRFTHQRLCEQVLLRHLRARLGARGGPSGDEINAWAEHASVAARERRSPGDASEPFVELVGALELLIEDLASSDGGGILVAVSKVADDTVRERLLIAALIRLGARLAGPAEHADARCALDALLEVAEGDAEAADRFEAVARRARTSLVNAGISAGAEHLDRARVSVARARYRLAPDEGTGRKLARCLSELAWLLAVTGLARESDALLSESVEVLRRLVADAREPSDIEHELARTLATQSERARSLGRTDAALKLCDESLAISRRLVALPSPPTGADRSLASVLLDRSKLSRDREELRRALELAQEAAGLLDALFERWPDLVTLAQERWNAHFSLAKIEWKRWESSLPDPNEAGRARVEQLLRLLVDLARATAAHAPHRSEPKADLAIALNHLGVFCALPRPRRTEVAKPAETALLAEAVEITQSLLASEPNRTEYRRLFALQLHDLAVAQASEGLRSKAREVIKRLHHEHPDREDLKADAAMMRGEHLVARGPEWRPRVLGMEVEPPGAGRMGLEGERLARRQALLEHRRRANALVADRVAWRNAITRILAALDTLATWAEETGRTSEGWRLRTNACRLIEAQSQLHESSYAKLEWAATLAKVCRLAWIPAGGPQAALAQALRVDCERAESAHARSEGLHGDGHPRWSSDSQRGVDYAAAGRTRAIEASALGAEDARERLRRSWRSCPTAEGCFEQLLELVRWAHDSADPTDSVEPSHAIVRTEQERARLSEDLAHARSLLPRLSASFAEEFFSRMAESNLRVRLRDCSAWTDLLRDVSRHLDADASTPSAGLAAGVRLLRRARSQYELELRPEALDSLTRAAHILEAALEAAPGSVDVRIALAITCWEIWRWHTDETPRWLALLRVESVLVPLGRTRADDSTLGLLTRAQAAITVEHSARNKEPPTS